jgi:hypothetical protein
VIHLSPVEGFISEKQGTPVFTYGGFAHTGVRGKSVQSRTDPTTRRR